MRAEDRGQIAAWSRMFAEVLDEVDSAFLVFGPWPDSMAATALVRRAATEQGVGVSLRPAVPEELLSVIEEAFAEDSALMLVDIIPTGPGPLGVAEQLWGQVLILDHYNPETPKMPSRVIRLNPLSAGMGPVQTSELALSVLRYLCPDAPSDLWVGRLGCLEPGSSCPGQVVGDDPEISEAYDILLKAVAADPESGVVLGVAALEECSEDPSCLLEGRYPLSKALLELSAVGGEALSSLHLARPLISSRRLTVVQVEDPRIRHVSAEYLARTSDVAGAAYSDGVMAVLSMRTLIEPLDLPSLVHLSLLDLEGSYFGAGGLVEVAVRAEHLETLLRRISELLGS